MVHRGDPVSEARDHRKSSVLIEERRGRPHIHIPEPILTVDRAQGIVAVAHEGAQRGTLTIPADFEVSLRPGGFCEWEINEGARNWRWYSVKVYEHHLEVVKTLVLSRLPLAPVVIR